MKQKPREALKSRRILYSQQMTTKNSALFNPNFSPLRARSACQKITIRRNQPIQSGRRTRSKKYRGTSVIVRKIPLKRILGMAFENSSADFRPANESPAKDQWSHLELPKSPSIASPLTDTCITTNRSFHSPKRHESAGSQHIGVMSRIGIKSLAKSFGTGFRRQSDTTMPKRSQEFNYGSRRTIQSQVSQMARRADPIVDEVRSDAGRQAMPPA